MFQKITAKNFLSWEDLEFEFEPGVSLIEGFNHDDQTSEGSGKSAVLNALCWGLYGGVPKDAKIDDVIREGTKSCEVVILLEDGLEIIRSRRPNELYMLSGPQREKVKGKDAKETQGLIEDRIGMSFDTFCQAVYWAQNYPKKFVTATEEEKAKILSEILDLKVFDRARAEALTRLRALDLTFAGTERDLYSTDQKIISVDRQISDFEFLQKEEEKNHQWKILSLEDEIEEVEVEISAQEALLANTPELEHKISEYEQALAEMKDVRKDLVERDFAIRTREALERDLSANEARLVTAKNSIRDISEDQLALDDTNLQKATAQLNAESLQLSVEAQSVGLQKKLKDEAWRNLVRKINDLEGLESAVQHLQDPDRQKCEACGTPLADADPEALGMAIVKAKQKAQICRVELVAMENAYEKMKVREAPKIELRLTEIARELEGIERDKRRLLSTQRTFDLGKAEEKTITEQICAMHVKLSNSPQGSSEEVKAMLLEFDADVQELQKQLKATEAEQKTVILLERELGFNRGLRTKYATDLANALKKKESSFVPLLKKLYAEKTEIENSRAKIAESLTDAKALRLRLQALREGFKEIKSYVFQSILGELTRISNEFLVELFEAPIELNFTNLSDDGDVAKIQVEVTYEGIQRPLGLYSGGQFRRIQLAVDLAVSEIVASRGSNPIQLRILDEAMKDLSEESMDKILGLLGRLPGSTILIEHNSMFKSIVNNVFQVELRDGVSRRVA